MGTLPSIKQWQRQFGKNVTQSEECLRKETLTTVFFDTRLWKTKHKTPAETFPKFPSVLRVIDRWDRIHQSQPDSMT